MSGEGGEREEPAVRIVTNDNLSLLIFPVISSLIRGRLLVIYLIHTPKFLSIHFPINFKITEKILL